MASNFLSISVYVHMTVIWPFHFVFSWLILVNAANGSPIMAAQSVASTVLSPTSFPLAARRDHHSRTQSRTMDASAYTFGSSLSLPAAVVPAAGEWIACTEVFAVCGHVHVFNPK